MTETDLLQAIFHRLDQSQNMEVIFSKDEIAHWPAGTFLALRKNKWLQKTSQAEKIVCQGCEEYCFMPVDIYPAIHNQSPRAFIACDKRDDIGRVSVEFTQLEQWKITGALLAKRLAQLFDIKKPLQICDGSKSWILGSLKGKKLYGRLVLLIDGGVFLKLSGHQWPLDEILSFHANKFILDKKKLMKAVDNPDISPKLNYKPNSISLESRKLKTREQYGIWQGEYQKLKVKYPNKSNSWYALQIEKNKSANPNRRSAETIRKNMKNKKLGRKDFAQRPPI